MSEGSSDGIEGRSDIIIYQTGEGRCQIQVKLENETVWLTQSMMAELYQTTKQNISLHIRNIYREGELTSQATVKKYLTVQREISRTVKRQLAFYSLEMIIAVGYRVRSGTASRFRQWATERLHEYLVKGFTLDDEFFAVMQNKMHFAATGMTAAEIVRRRADSEQANMGLTTWSGERVLKRDVGTAKNYLTEAEIDTLNRIVVMFVDQAEFRALRRQNIKMRDWEFFLDKFLRDTDLAVLGGAGSVRQDDARRWAEEQYDAFAERRRYKAEAVAEENYSGSNSGGRRRLR